MRAANFCLMMKTNKKSNSADSKYDLAIANFCFRSSVCGFFMALYSKNSICVDFRLFTYLYYTFFHFFSTLCSVVSVWLAFWRLYYLQKGIYVGEYWCFPNRLTTTTRFATNKISIMPLLFFFNSPKPWRVLSPSFQIQWKLLQLALLPL